MHGKDGERMLPEIDRTNLAYDLSRYDNAARKEQENRAKDRERREREIKMSKHSASRSGSKFRLVLCAAAVFGAFWMVNVQNTRADDYARMVDDQKALLAELQDENSLLQGRLDSKVNIGYIEEYATEQLGMGKVSNSQINYLSVNTEDLIEVSPEEGGNIFTAIADWFGDMLEYIGF